MKTFKSIQKNQEQLNSLLMEKWGYKNALTEEKTHDGSCEDAHSDMSHEEWEAEEKKNSDEPKEEE